MTRDVAAIGSPAARNSRMYRRLWTNPLRTFGRTNALARSIDAPVARGNKASIWFHVGTKCPKYRQIAIAFALSCGCARLGAPRGAFLPCCLASTTTAAVSPDTLCTEHSIWHRTSDDQAISGLFLGSRELMAGVDQCRSARWGAFKPFHGFHTLDTLAELLWTSTYHAKSITYLQIRVRSSQKSNLIRIRLLRATMLIARADIHVDFPQNAIKLLARSTVPAQIPTANHVNWRYYCSTRQQ